MDNCTFIYLGMREPHPCSHEVEFEVYDFRSQQARRVCGKHVESILRDFNLTCLVKPIRAKLADRSPDDRRGR